MVHMQTTTLIDAVGTGMKEIDVFLVLHDLMHWTSATRAMSVLRRTFAGMVL